MDQRSCIGYERGVIRSPVESLVQRTVTTSVFPTFLLSLITFPLLFTCISIYPINILLSPVPSPIFTNCTPASNRLFRHLCTNTPLPCLVDEDMFRIQRSVLNGGAYVVCIRSHFYAGYSQSMKSKQDLKLQYLLSAY